MSHYHILYFGSMKALAYDFPQNNVSGKISCIKIGLLPINWRHVTKKCSKVVQKLWQAIDRNFQPVGWSSR